MVTVMEHPDTDIEVDHDSLVNPTKDSKGRKQFLSRPPNCIEKNHLRQDWVNWGDGLRRMLFQVNLQCSQC